MVTYTTAMSACAGHWQAQCIEADRGRQAVLQLLRELGAGANAWAYTTAMKVRSFFDGSHLSWEVCGPASWPLALLLLEEMRGLELDLTSLLSTKVSRSWTEWPGAEIFECS